MQKQHALDRTAWTIDHEVLYLIKAKEILDEISVAQGSARLRCVSYAVSFLVDLEISKTDINFIFCFWFTKVAQVCDLIFVWFKNCFVSYKIIFVRAMSPISYARPKNMVRSPSQPAAPANRFVQTSTTQPMVTIPVYPSAVPANRFVPTSATQPMITPFYPAAPANSVETLTNPFTRLAALPIMLPNHISNQLIDRCCTFLSSYLEQEKLRMEQVKFMETMGLAPCSVPDARPSNISPAHPTGSVQVICTPPPPPPQPPVVAQRAALDVAPPRALAKKRAARPAKENRPPVERRKKDKIAKSLKAEKNTNQQQKVLKTASGDREVTTFKRFIIKDFVHNFEPYEEDGYLVMGPNGTRITLVQMKKLRWAKNSFVLRGILESVFPPEILSSHSLTGNPSPGKDHIVCI